MGLTMFMFVSPCFKAMSGYEGGISVCWTAHALCTLRATARKEIRKCKTVNSFHWSESGVTPRSRRCDAKCVMTFLSLGGFSMRKLPPWTHELPLFQIVLSFLNSKHFQIILSGVKCDYLTVCTKKSRVIRTIWEST